MTAETTSARAVDEPALDRLKSRNAPRLRLLYGSHQAGAQPGAVADSAGDEIADQVMAQIIERARRYRSPAHRPRSLSWDEKDVLIITYGDSVHRPGEKPLKTLGRFLSTYLSGAFSGVHILPFFPYSSDDGFSVVNYREVDPGLGFWSDVQAISDRFDLMIDLVCNHVSRESVWFQDYKLGIEPARDFFIGIDEHAEVSQVVRPRPSDLRVPVQTATGPRHVWATFSDDQIDLNYRNPKVLLEMLEVLLFYLRMGARFVRLDAVAFLWKQLGTKCIHLPETHAVVKLMRDIVETVEPGAKLITETNVPNAENLSYFGTGDEAHMVYQFSLAPPAAPHAAIRLSRGAFELGTFPESVAAGLHVPELCRVP